jgi:hypothetical protein
MLFCGLRNNPQVKMALDYLPDNIWENINEKVAFIILNSDACRLTSIIREYEEVIILSPWIFPYKFFTENEKGFRYFIFCVLHEVAHIILKHKSPLDCSVQEKQKQEKGADGLALKWFNSHVSEFIERGLLPLPIEEIRNRQELNQSRLESILDCT